MAPRQNTWTVPVANQNTLQCIHLFSDRPALQLLLGIFVTHEGPFLGVPPSIRGGSLEMSTSILLGGIRFRISRSSASNSKVFSSETLSLAANRCTGKLNKSVYYINKKGYGLKGAKISGKQP